MGEESSSKHSKGSRSHEKDPDRKSKKKRKHDDDGGKKHKHKKVKEASSSKLTVVDDDPDDEDMWVEKNIDMDGERVSPMSLHASLFSYSLQGSSHRHPHRQQFEANLISHRRPLCTSSPTQPDHGIQTPTR